MVAPSGCSGVQRVPKAGHSCGFLSALQDQAADALAGLVHVHVGHAEARARRRTPRRRGAGPGRCAGISPMPRHLRGTHLEHLARSAAARGWLPSRRTARAYWFSTSRAALLELLHAHEDALQDVQRLEAGDHDRHPVLRRRAARTRRSPSPCRRGRRPGSPAPGCPATARMASIAGGTSTCETSMEKFSRPSLRGLVHRHGVGRRGGLEADGEEHHLAVGILPRQLHARRAASRRCARRRPPALTASRSCVAARHAQHVAERAEDHARAAPRWPAPCRSARAA